MPAQPMRATMACASFCSRNGKSLAPGQGALTGEPAKLNDRSRDEIRWTCGAGPGVLTRYAPGDFMVFLRMQASRKRNGQYDLGLLRRPSGESEVVHENDTWVPLIEDIGSVANSLLRSTAQHLGGPLERHFDLAAAGEGDDRAQ